MAEQLGLEGPGFEGPSGLVAATRPTGEAKGRLRRRVCTHQERRPESLGGLLEQQPARVISLGAGSIEVALGPHRPPEPCHCAGSEPESSESDQRPTAT